MMADGERRQDKTPTNEGIVTSFLAGADNSGIPIDSFNRLNKRSKWGESIDYESAPTGVGLMIPRERGIIAWLKILTPSSKIIVGKPKPDTTSMSSVEIARA